MAFRVESLPSLEAVEERLSSAVAALQQSPLDRVNVLVGSNLQRIYLRRRIAEQLAFSANVRFYTPVGLAEAIRECSSLEARQPLPDGAEPILLDGIIRELRAQGSVARLDPEVRGVPAAVSGSLTDLREAQLDPGAFHSLLAIEDDRKLTELALIYDRFIKRMQPFYDRTGAYIDALAAPDGVISAALGGRPLLVVGLYDAPAVQAALIARVGAVIETRVMLVAPNKPEFAFVRSFREELVVRGAVAIDASDELSAEEPGLDAGFEQRMKPWCFSAPTRQAEAEEVVRRALWLAREHEVAFDQMAVLHRLDHAADDVIAAAFGRAGIPVYRASGHPLRHSAVGRAALVLLELVLGEPQRHRLLEFVGNPSLRPTLPIGGSLGGTDGTQPKPLLWERVSKQAGMVAGWQRFLEQLDAHIAERRRDEHPSRDYALDTASELRSVVADLAGRARVVDELDSWSGYAGWFLVLLDTYLMPPSEERPDGAHDPALTLRNRIEALSHLDSAGVPVDRESFGLAAEQAIRRAVVNERPPLSKGVFVGNVGAARSLRFEAVFLVECAERIFPPLVRQDPLLLDVEREQINQRAGRLALPLKRDRLSEEEMLFQLVWQSARRFLTISWARRTNTTGAPRLPSSYLLRSIPGHADELARIEELFESGEVHKLATRLAGAGPSVEEITAGNWDRVTEALDESDLRLAILESTPRTARDLISQLWDGYERWSVARRARSASTFGEWDGIIPIEAIGDQPLEKRMSPTALETYATCPYRYFMRQLLHVRAIPEPGEALQMSPLDRGSMVHRILENWVREGIASEDWPAFVENSDRLLEMAEESFESWGHGGLSGLPATWAIVRAEVRADLKELVRREQAKAREGIVPVTVEDEFGFARDVELELRDGTRLKIYGRIDRVDRDAEGRLMAIDYKTGRAFKKAESYKNGSALQLPLYIHGVADKYGVPRDDVAAEYWYATHKGGFEQSGLRGVDVFNDDLLWSTLDTIVQGIRGGVFPPYAGRGQGQRERPNCTFCDYFDVCTTDVHRRFEHKLAGDIDTVRDFLMLQGRS